MLISVNVRSLQIVILKFQETFAVRLPHNSKMESTLFVPENLSFSEYLRCLNFPLWTFWPAKTKQVKKSDLF